MLFVTHYHTIIENDSQLKTQKILRQRFTSRPQIYLKILIVEYIPVISIHRAHRASSFYLTYL